MNILHKVRGFLKRYDVTIFEAVIFLGVYLVFLSNTTYVSYPDEFINLLAGKAILAGKLPYVQFFDHHLPFAWYFSALLMIFSKSFVIFRLLWATAQFALLLSVGLWIKRNFVSFYQYYLGFLILYPMAAVYFWFHLYVADSLATLFFSAVFWILIVQTLTKRVSEKSVYIASLLTFCLVFSSLTYLYLAAILYLWQFILLRLNLRKMLMFIGVSAAPYILYLLYLLVTGSLADFYFANFVYNTKLYISIPNYVRGAHFNPLKFGMTIIFNFWTNYLPLLTRVKNLDLYLPVMVLSGVSTLFFLLHLAPRYPLVAGLFFFLLSFSAPRSNVQTQNETDYQASLFIALGLSCAFLVIYIARESKWREALYQDLTRIAQTIVAILLLFTALFLAGNTYNKFFLRYTQQLPSIRNSSDTSIFLNKILTDNDYFWMGPYEPQETFFVRRGHMPEKFPSLLPQFKEDEEMKQKFLAQFNEHLPSVIIYRHTASIFMTPAEQFGDFFLAWMKDKYVNVDSIKGVKIKQSPSSFTLGTDMYLLNSKKTELLEALRREGFVE